MEIDKSFHGRMEVIVNIMKQQESVRSNGADMLDEQYFSLFIQSNVNNIYFFD